MDAVAVVALAAIAAGGLTVTYRLPPSAARGSRKRASAFTAIVVASLVYKLNIAGPGWQLLAYALAVGLPFLVAGIAVMVYEARSDNERLEALKSGMGGQL